MAQRLKVLTLLLLSLFFIGPSWAGTSVDYDDANCVAAWLMDIDEDPITDSSGEGHTGAWRGVGEPDHATADPPPGGFSTGYYVYNGDQNDYIKVVSDTDFNFGDDFSIVGWEYLLSYDPQESGTNYMIYYHTRDRLLGEGSETRSWQFAIRGDEDATNVGKVVFTYNVAGNGLVYSTGVPGLNAWHHIAVTFDNSDPEYIFYIDGVSSGSGATDITPVTAAGSVGVGAGENVPNSYVSFWYGRIDELADFTRELSSTEVNDLMDNGLAPVVVAAANKLYDAVIYDAVIYSGGLPTEIYDSTIFDSTLH